MKRVVTTVAIAVAALLFGRAVTADAHANLARSEPAANSIVPTSPARVFLEFTERPDLGFSRVLLFDANGRRVADSPLTSQGGGGETVYFEPGQLTKGTYTVAWRALSTVDGHETQGTFAFSVGEQTAVAPADVEAFGTSLPPKYLSVASRWLTFVSTVLVVGFAGFQAMVLWPAVRKSASSATTRESLSGLIRRSWWFALSFGLVATVLALVSQAWRNAGGFGDGLGALGDMLADTRFGDIWLLRAGVLLLLAELTALFGQRFLTPRHRGVTASAIVLGAALVLPATSSLNSHAAAGDDLTVIATVADWVHTVGASFWLGGLVLFVLVLRTGLPRSSQDDRTKLLASMLPRFSLLAIAAVGAISLTGAFQWALQVGNLDDTVSSGFGQSLIAKTLLLAPMLGLGALHLLRVSPVFRTAAVSVGQMMARAGAVERLFRRTLLLEATLGIALLLATGFLTDTSPPGRVAAAPRAAFSQTQTIDDLDVTLTINPNRPGNNEIVAAFVDKRGSKQAITNVIMRFNYLEQQLGEAEAHPEAAPDSSYRLSGLQLGIPGRWAILVIVQREGVADVRATFEVAVSAQ